MDAKLRKQRQAEEQLAKDIAAHAKDVAEFCVEQQLPKILEEQYRIFEKQCRLILQWIGLGILVPGDGGVL